MEGLIEPIIESVMGRLLSLLHRGSLSMKCKCWQKHIAAIYTMRKVLLLSLQYMCHCIWMQHVESHHLYICSMAILHSARCRIQDLQGEARARGIPGGSPSTLSSGHIIVGTYHVSEGRVSNASYACLMMASQKCGEIR